MEEKNEIKIKLSTVIYLIIIVTLVVVLGVTYYFGFVADKKENVGEENVANTIENKVDEEIEKDININIGEFSVTEIKYNDILYKISLLKDNNFNISRK